MGLDWRIDAKAVPGHEEEAKRIRQSFAAVSAEDKAQLVARYQVITVPPFTTLGAPVIGKDDAANAWLLEQYRSQNGGQVPTPDPHLPRNEQEIGEIQKYAGYHVLQLLPDCDGFPHYSNAYLYASADRTSLRAQFLLTCIEVIGSDLVDKAYQRMEPEVLLEYGNALLGAARVAANRFGCTELELQRDAPQVPEGAMQSQIHIVFAAAKWCLYWGQRGYGLEPDY